MNHYASNAMLESVPARGLQPDSERFVTGHSPVMQVIERVLQEIAPTEIPILLVGESGTGKEVVALRIHSKSSRCEGPFVRLGCATLQAESFAQSFGVNGSGPSLYERGTVYLDEVSDLPMACQVKLLSLLTNGNGHGGNGADISETPRLICSATRRLEEEMQAGRFREDLYYRLNGVTLRLPPLRQRREDIPAFVEFFLRQYAHRLERPLPALNRQTLTLLQSQPWSGNIRELENVVRMIVLLGDGATILHDLQPITAGAETPGAAEGPSLKDAARAASRMAERELILKVLNRTRWNRKRAAQELQISYKALLYKLKQIGLEDGVDSADFGTGFGGRLQHE